MSKCAECGSSQEFTDEVIDRVAIGSLYCWACAHAEIYQLRLLLALQYGGVSLYMDDGELQDSRAYPSIDFRRDSTDVIQNKMWVRSKHELDMRELDAATGSDGL